jgi:phosphatidylinositol alpha-mannosyltransferase
MKNDPRLKVGLVFDDTLDSSDGVAQYVKTLGAWLSDRGHSVCYLVGETSLESWHNGRVYSLSKNVRVTFNGNKLSMPLPAKNRRLKRVIATQDLDVIHVMVPYSPFMAAKVIKSVSRKTAVIGTFHIFPSGWLSAVGSKLLWMILARTLRRFDQIVSVSSAASQFAHDSYHTQTKIIPNMIDVKKYKAKPSIDGPGKTIVFLGRLVDRKGARYLVEAFAGLGIKDARLLIAGDGPQRGDLEALAARLGIRDRVEFLGYIDESDKPSLLASADIACFPSLYGESFGIVLLEAMAAGAKVVLAGDNPGYRSVLGEQPGLLVDPRKTDQFALRLKELLIDERQIEPLTEWQRETVRQYDVDVVGEKLLGIYSGQIARLAKKSNNKAHG